MVWVDKVRILLPFLLLLLELFLGLLFLQGTSLLASGSDGWSSIILVSGFLVFLFLFLFFL